MNITDLSAIWPETLCEVGLQNDLGRSHENWWDKDMMAIWARDRYSSQSTECGVTSAAYHLSVLEAILRLRSLGGSGRAITGEM